MQFDSSVFWTALTSSDFLYGALLAVGLALVSQILAVVGGFLLMLMRTSTSPPVRVAASAYIWFFRAVPTLLVLLVAWNAAPQVFPVLVGEWYKPFLAALIGFTVVESAYMAEILRSAYASIDDGQRQAARALGLPPGRVMTKVLIPQMIRVAIPPTGNEFIGMVKYTSLASVIGLRELMSIAQAGVSVTFSYAEYYSAAMIYYLLIVSVLMVGQSRLERRYRWTGGQQRGKARTANLTTVRPS